MDDMPRDNQAINQATKYYRLAAKAISNFNNKFGLKFDVYRIVDRATNKDVKSWGPSTAQQKSTKKLKYLKTITCLNSPTEIYNKLHANQNTIQIKLGTDELLVGDILKLPWYDNETLEFSINEQPATFAGAFYIYNIESIHRNK